MKIKNVLAFILIFICSLSVGCKGTQTESDIGAGIITDYLSNKYDYTITYYNIAPEGKETFMYAFEGQFISNPYQQYEKLIEPVSEIPGIQEVYYYEKDGNIYSDTKLYTSSENDSKWLTGMPAENRNIFMMKMV